MRREETKNVILVFVSCFSITCENNYGRSALRAAPPPGPPVQNSPFPIQACTGVNILHNIIEGLPAADPEGEAWVECAESRVLSEECSV
jgi:hypothetical protein